MSKWYDLDWDDVYINRQAKDVFVCVCHNDQGSINLVLSFDQIKELAAKIEKDKPGINDSLNFLVLANTS